MRCSVYLGNRTVFFIDLNLPLHLQNFGTCTQLTKVLLFQNRLFCRKFRLFFFCFLFLTRRPMTSQQARSQGGTREQCPPKFVVPRTFFIKTDYKNKTLAPLKMYFVPPNLET